MLKRVLFRAAAVAVALVLGAGSARADFVIDDFTQPPTFTGLIGITGNGAQSATRTDNYTVPGQGSLTRLLTVNQTQNVLGNNATQYGIGGIGAGGIFTLATANGTSQATATTANASLRYTYGAAQNLSNAGTSVQFTFSGADQGTPYSVTLGSGANTSTLSGTATNGAGVYSLSVGSFGGIDLSNITSILLSLNLDTTGANSPVASADFTLNDVRILTPTPTTPQVPAPPAAVLVLAAAPLLGLARARRALPV